MGGSFIFCAPHQLALRVYEKSLWQEAHLLINSQVKKDKQRPQVVLAAEFRVMCHLAAETHPEMGVV